MVNFDATPPPDVHPNVEQDGDSNSLKAGDKIYERNGIDKKSEIVVTDNGLYVRALNKAGR
ncbi:hypothetical protein [Paenibacillus sp. R14(2021)]|uniref:hypothetical protein n=1 Tax=Paenibacillus sp. R14(2021) TaxID=2859228 RepID=UPI001C612335|nr:hypothetical protein [Paenibacillus sp. R14(2021)]